MVRVLLVLLAAPVYLPCGARAAAKDRAKIIEEYVVSAKFDENKSFPQLHERSPWREDTKIRSEEKEAALLDMRDGGHHYGELSNREALEERDFLVHHHHLPPAPHHPPHPPHLGLPYAPYLFSVGLIVFFILLNSLQTSFLLLKSKGSLLGSVTGALGRRKRSAWERTEANLGNYAENRLNLTLNSNRF